MSIAIAFELLSPGDYERAKAVLNKARHPGFVGRELFYRCATAGQCVIARVEDADAGVALITKGKLQALSVDRAFQGRGVGQALIGHTQPRFVQATEERVGWFEKLGYERLGAPKIGANGKHATQLMHRSGAEPMAEVQIREAPRASPVSTDSASEAPTGGGIGGTESESESPSDPRELAARAMRYLLGVMSKDLGDRQLAVGVAAASRVLSHSEWLHENSVGANVIAYLGGPAKAAHWLAENRERLELLLASGDPMGLVSAPSPGDTSAPVLEAPSPATSSKT